MAAVANATGLVPQARGLGFPACGTGELAAQLRPAATAACSTAAARSRWSRACTPDGSPVAGDLRWGVYVTIAAADRFVAGAFAAYGVATSRDGRVAALWRPSHLVGLELGVSVARAALAGEPTGVARAPIAEVACRAKRDLRAGETIDGEGGEHVYGMLRARDRRQRRRALPMGLARGARLVTRHRARRRGGARGRRNRAIRLSCSGFTRSSRECRLAGRRRQYTRELARRQPEGDPGRFESGSALRVSRPPTTGAKSSCRVSRHRQAAARILRHRARPAPASQRRLALSGSHADSRPSAPPFAEAAAVPSRGGIRRGALAPSAQAGGVSRAPSLLALHPGVQGPAVKKLQRMLARLGYPDQARRAVRPAHGDDGAHAARRCGPRSLGTRHEAVPQRPQARAARWARRPPLARHPQAAGRRPGQGRPDAPERADATGLPGGDGRAVRPCDAEQRAHVRACGRAAGRRGADAARGADAQAGGALGRHRRRGVAALDAGDLPATATPPVDQPTGQVAPHRRPRPRRSAPTASRSRRPAPPRPSPRSSRPAT